ncbi:MAG: twin-arginine translocase TatA/TatE family subunit [Gemmatimonadota bacterium]|nr:twin-arginine translocase TatA/TatE family subunit [Gemmatimonadota bacterium]
MPLRLEDQHDLQGCDECAAANNRKDAITMISGFGIWEIGLILLFVLFFFGSKRIPVIARGLGEGIRNFKGALRKGDDSSDDHLLEESSDKEQP